MSIMWWKGINTITTGQNSIHPNLITQETMLPLICRVQDTDHASTWRHDLLPVTMRGQDIHPVTQQMKLPTLLSRKEAHSPFIRWEQSTLSTCEENVFMLPSIEERNFPLPSGPKRPFTFPFIEDTTFRLPPCEVTGSFSTRLRTRHSSFHHMIIGPSPYCDERNLHWPGPHRTTHPSLSPQQCRVLTLQLGENRRFITSLHEDSAFTLPSWGNRNFKAIFTRGYSCHHILTW